MSDSKNPYAGHRQRLRQRYRITGLKGFQDYEALELLLFYAIPRRDVRPLARELVRQFGSLQKVLDASTNELLQVPGVGPKTVSLLHLIPAIVSGFIFEKPPEVRYVMDTKGLQELLSPELEKATEPSLYVVLLDRTLAHVLTRNFSEIALNEKRIASLVREYGAESVVMLEVTPMMLTEAYKTNFHRVTLWRETLFHLNVILADYCLWSIPEQKLASYHIGGALPRTFLPRHEFTPSTIIYSSKRRP